MHNESVKVRQIKVLIILSFIFENEISYRFDNLNVNAFDLHQFIIGRHSNILNIFKK